MIKIPKSLMLFWRKILEKNASYFHNFLAKFSLTLTKNGWFYIVLANLNKKKKNPTKMENLGRLHP